MVTRDQLDAWASDLPLPTDFIAGGFAKVNGSLGHYKLWYPMEDRSVLPCLLGKVGGMRGAWENWITAWHYNNLNQYDTYIDIGANGGYYSFLAYTQGLTVHAFEANQVYFSCLNSSTRDNGAVDRVTIHHAAVSDKDGAVELTVPDELHGGASIRHSDSNLPGRTEKVRAVTLDSFFKSRTPIGYILVKMDIEGAEQMAWHGAKAFNEKHRPTYIIEYTPRHYDGNFFDELEEYGPVTMVNFEGSEEPITKAQADATEDWITLVVRPWE